MKRSTPPPSSVNVDWNLMKIMMCLRKESCLKRIKREHVKKNLEKTGNK